MINKLIDIKISEAESPQTTETRRDGSRYNPSTILKVEENG